MKKSVLRNLLEASTHKLHKNMFEKCKKLKKELKNEEKGFAQSARGFNSQTAPQIFLNFSKNFKF